MESMRVKLEKEIMHTITITLIAVLFLSLITWKLSKLISQSISYPVRQLCEMTKEVAQGNFDVHGPQNTTEELQILTNNFEHMAQSREIDRRCKSRTTKSSKKKRAAVTTRAD